jgi:hypothetical protein
VKKINIIQTLIGVMLFAFVIKANAIPTLFFDGNVGYTASSGMLDVNAMLIGSEDIAPAPVLTGSIFDLSAIFLGLGAGSSATVTVGDFGGLAGDDLRIVGGDSTVLLEADLNALQMRGANGSDFGLMTATFAATGGSLLNSFSSSELFALQLNLTTTFNEGMFRSDFRGQIDGNLKSSAVPEPDIMALLAMGLVLMSLVTRLNKKI